MIVLIDTSSLLVHVVLVDGSEHYVYEWQADRTLARDLLAFLRDKLAEHGKTWQDITGIGVMKGPGSFTGLRIGIAVCNTLAHELNVPIVGESGEQWRMRALERLTVSETDEIILPEYGSEANVTKPRK